MENNNRCTRTATTPTLVPVSQLADPGARPPGTFRTTAGHAKEGVMNESRCPVMHGARGHAAGGGTSNRDWWPNQVKLNVLHQHSALSNPMGEAFDYAEAFRSPRPRRGQEGHLRADDHVAGMVAGRLRSLWPALHPDGMAQRGNLPDRRRPGRRAHRHAALRAAQQLARQRQPRQGAHAALAGQAEVRSGGSRGPIS